MPENRKPPASAAARKKAEERVEKAKADLDAAQTELAESTGELLGSTVLRGVPQMVVKVKPNAVIVHEGKAYHGKDYPLEHGEDFGDEVQMEGPTAVSMVMQGHGDILRSVPDGGDKS